MLYKSFENAVRKGEIARNAFISHGHNIQDFSFMPIEKVLNNWKRLLKETTWMHILGTITPNGMNSKILF